MCDIETNCTCKPTLGDTLVNMLDLVNDFYKSAQAFNLRMSELHQKLAEPDPVEGDGVLEQDSIEDYCTFCNNVCHCDLAYDVRQNELSD